MDNNVFNEQINEKLIMPPPSSNIRLRYKARQPVATKDANNKTNNSPITNRIIDYKNISLSMTGEISSTHIHRNGLTQKYNPDISLVEDTEENDEQFILNIKEIIDKNSRMYKDRDKENCRLRGLQSNSYLSKKKKGVFNDEAENLIKRFKKSVDDSKTSCVAPQDLQQLRTVTTASNYNCSMVTSTPRFAPTFSFDDIDTNSSNNTNQLLFHVSSKEQKNNQLITPEAVTKAVTETEIEELVFYEMQCFTPPHKDD